MTRKAPRTTPTPPPKPPTLAEQKADFTAEGSPPPGKVSTSVPQTVVGKTKKSDAKPV